MNIPEEFISVERVGDDIIANLIPGHNVIYGAWGLLNMYPLGGEMYEYFNSVMGERKKVQCWELRESKAT